MLRQSLSIVVLVASLAGSGMVFAQPGGDHGRDHDDGRVLQERQDAPQRHEADAPRAAAPQPHRDWHAGERMPESYRDPRHVVEDWRAHDLPKPPHGQHWVRVDGDYVLVAITTGVIMSILLAH